MQFVTMWVQIPPYTCYRHGLYTCLQPLTDPSGPAPAPRRHAEGAHRGAQGAAGTICSGATCRDRRPDRRHPTADSPQAHLPSPLSVTSSPRVMGTGKGGTHLPVWLAVDGGLLGALLRRPLDFTGMGDYVTVSADYVMLPAAADLHSRTTGNSPGCLFPAVRTS